MATLLDAGLLEKFSIVFAFLFVLVVLYGILTATNLFKGNHAIQAFIALLASIFMLLMPKLNQVILLMVPWMTLIFIFMLFIFLAFKMFGATDHDFMSVLSANRGLFWTVFWVFTIIFLWSIADVYWTPAKAEQSGEQAILQATTFSERFGAVFFHPTVFGTIVVLLIGLFAVSILASETGGVIGGGGH